MRSFTGLYPHWSPALAALLLVLATIACPVELISELASLAKQGLKSPPIDTKYVAIRQAIPPELTHLGYMSLTSSEIREQAFWYQTQYALAPRILVRRPEAYVMACIPDPKALEDVLSDGFSVIAQGPPDMYLLRKRQP